MRYQKNYSGNFKQNVKPFIVPNRAFHWLKVILEYIHSLLILSFTIFVFILFDNASFEALPQIKLVNRQTVHKEDSLLQKQLFTGVLKKMCSENMQQIYRRKPLSKCDFMLLRDSNETPFLITCGVKIRIANLRTKSSVKDLSLKLVSAIFCYIFIFNQMIALQKKKKKFFISSKKLFSLSRYSNFRISVFLSFFPCQPLLRRLI